MVSWWEETQPLQKREDNTGRAETSRDLRVSEIGLAINVLDILISFSMIT